MDDRRNISHSGDSAKAAAEKSVSNAAETSGTSTVGTSCTVAAEASTDNMKTTADNTVRSESHCAPFIVCFIFR